MLPHPAEITRAFDLLAIARQPTFRQLVGGRLRYAAAAEGTCDVVDDYSSRLICECIANRSSLLMVWPDLAERRAPLALAAGIVCDSVPRVRGESGQGRILYVGPDSSLKGQFASIRLSNTPLTGVFSQEFARGDSQVRRVGPQSSLPVISMIVSPAQPEKIIKVLRPRWIAVDCGSRNAPQWLPELLTAAKSLGVPVIGWSALHLSAVPDLWRAQGGCVYRWPKVCGTATRIASLDEFRRRAGAVQLTPMILDGQDSVQVAEQLAQCYLRLVRHVGRANGRLGQNALSVAWRYLRLLESLPVPVDLYEAECANYWGMPALGRLQATLERFIQALNGDGVLRSDLTFSFERLVAAHGMLRDQGDPPLWLAAANLTVEAAAPSLFAFQNRAYRELFKFALLSKFNVSEDDLRGLGVSLAALSDVPRRGCPGANDIVTLVGLPSRASEWRMEPLLDSGELRTIVWPHLEDTLQRRASEWSSQLSGGCDGHSPLRLPTASVPEPPDKPRVRIGGRRTVTVGELKQGVAPLPRGSGLALWKRPDAAEAIRALFAIDDTDDDVSQESAPIIVDGDAVAEPTPVKEDWMEEALLVAFDDGGKMLLPLDDCVNVVCRTADGVRLVSRFSRSLRVGDEILLVHGEHRQSLYNLLLSRVHSHATITPWIELIDRWHQDLRVAFRDAQQRRGMTFESLLFDLQQGGSTIMTPASVRNWILGVVLAPSDWHDIRRLGEILNVTVAKQFAREIGNAAGRLAGLHRSLSNRLNRWLASEDAGAAALAAEQVVVDADLGLTMSDFRDSLVRGRVASVAKIPGPFLRSHVGYLMRASQ